MSSPSFSAPGSRIGMLAGTASNPFNQASSGTKPVKTTDYGDFAFENAKPALEKSYANLAELGTGFDAPFTTEDATVSEGGAGSLAKVFIPKPGKGKIDIIKNYPWTASNTLNKNDIPFIQIKEHKIEGGQIQQQMAFYAYGSVNAAEDLANLNVGKDILDVYKEIFPRNETGFIYKFPYFAKAYFELSTPQWQQFDKIGSAGSDIASGLGKLGDSVFGDKSKISAGMDFLKSAASLATNVGITTLQTVYPVVGIADRPRIFTSHNERTVKIEFPLYNTFQERDWVRNKDFIYLFGAQNLFNKRNFITGLPPVWYEVYVPGSYYSVASCVTQFDVQNLGNIRLMSSNGGVEFNVPDAYQISISLTEMALPSRNQFQAANSPLGASRVESSTVVEGLNEVQQARNELNAADTPEASTGVFRPISSSSLY